MITSNSQDITNFKRFIIAAKQFPNFLSKSCVMYYACNYGIVLYFYYTKQMFIKSILKLDVNIYTLHIF